MSAHGGGSARGGFGAESGTFHAPRTLAEALAVLGRTPGLRVVAGGTDVMPRLTAATAPDGWLSLHEVEGLAGAVATGDGGLRIGAATTHATLVDDPRVRAQAAAVAEAAALVGAPSTRSVGTIGGNLVNGSPAMELGPPLLALGARVELASAAGGTRTVALADFLLGPGRTDLRAGELLTAVTVPRVGMAGSAYARVVGRGAMEVSLAGAAAWVVLAADGRTVADARIALGAVAPTPLWAPEAERRLIGAPVRAAAFAAAGEVAAQHAAPIDDHRSPAAYRAAMVAVVVRRALAAACAAAQGPGGRAAAEPTASGPHVPTRIGSAPSEQAALDLTVNDVPARTRARADATLLDVLREDLGLTGAKQGCEDGECGACTVLLDGRPVAACILLARQAARRDVRTVEGIGTAQRPHPLQRTLVEHGAVQCGFCTPGIVMAALGAFADPQLHPSEPEVRHAVAGNLCRCTGYQKVVAAVLAWTADHQREEHRGPST